MSVLSQTAQPIEDKYISQPPWISLLGPVIDAVMNERRQSGRLLISARPNVPLAVVHLTFHFCHEYGSIENELKRWLATLISLAFQLCWNVYVFDLFAMVVDQVIRWFNFGRFFAPYVHSRIESESYLRPMISGPLKSPMTMKFKLYTANVSGGATCCHETMDKTMLDCGMNGIRYLAHTGDYKANHLQIWKQSAIEVGLFEYENYLVSLCIHRADSGPWEGRWHIDAIQLACFVFFAAYLWPFRCILPILLALFLAVVIFGSHFSIARHP